jgi:hypothetical protein
MPKARFGVICLAIAFMCINLIGCSSKSSVEGSVNYDGKPVEGGQIIFFMEKDGKRSHIAQGSIDGGKYGIKSAELIPGVYRTEIYWNKKTGKQVMSNDPPNKIDEVIQVIPKKYNVASTETVELKSGPNTQNFDLKFVSPPPPKSNVNDKNN